MELWSFVVFLLVLLVESRSAYGAKCNEDEPQKCASKADHLLKDPDLVFPDNSVSVDRVCRTWNDFKDCIYNFTKRCLTPQQQLQFERSFRDPVTSMRTLCEDSSFRREYLQYAPCIKKVSTDKENCGRQYKFLIDNMAGGSTGVKAICCARTSFKKCVELKTREKCDMKGAGSEHVQLNATAFAVKALDKSLAFVTQQCGSSSFKEEDCKDMPDMGKYPSGGGLSPGSNETETQRPITGIVFSRPRRTTEKPTTAKPKNDSVSVLHNSPLLLLVFHSVLLYSVFKQYFLQ